jgi:hypothetical protein
VAFDVSRHTVALLALVRHGMRSGRYDDMDLREQRLVLIAVGVSGIGVAAGSLAALHGPRLLLAMLISLPATGRITVGKTVPQPLTIEPAEPAAGLDS